MNFLRRVHPVLANIVKISGYPLISVPCFYSRIKTYPTEQLHIAIA